MNFPPQQQRYESASQDAPDCTACTDHKTDFTICLVCLHLQGDTDFLLFRSIKQTPEGDRRPLSELLLPRVCQSHYGVCKVGEENRVPDAAMLNVFELCAPRQRRNLWQLNYSQLLSAPTLAIFLFCYYVVMIVRVYAHLCRA